MNSNFIKLPTITPTSFSGKYVEWNPFKDQFVCMIAENPRVPPVQKMQYLLTALSGPAKDIIKHLPITATNYVQAWDLPVQRYENHRAIFISCMQDLTGIEKYRKESIEGLQQLSSIVQETVETLKSVQVKTEYTDPIIAYLA